MSTILGNPITLGGAKPKLQEKSVTYVSNGTASVTPDAGYDALGRVDVVVNVTPTLLWTNPNPQTAFTEQTLSFGGSYGCFIVETKKGVNSNETGMGFLSSGVTAANGSHIPGYWGGTYSIPDWQRSVKSTSANSITFSSSCGYRQGTSTYGNSRGEYGIPTRIWGVEFNPG